MRPRTSGSSPSGGDPTAVLSQPRPQAHPILVTALPPTAPAITGDDGEAEAQSCQDACRTDAAGREQSPLFHTRGAGPLWSYKTPSLCTNSLVHKEREPLQASCPRGAATAAVPEFSPREAWAGVPACGSLPAERESSHPRVTRPRAHSLQAWYRAGCRSHIHLFIQPASTY